MANGSVARHAKRWSRRRLTSRKKQGRQTLVPGPWFGHHTVRKVNGDDNDMRLVFRCSYLASSLFPPTFRVGLAQPEVILCGLRTDALHLPIRLATIMDKSVETNLTKLTIVFL